MYVCICKYVCMYECMYVCMYVCMYLIYIYIYIYIYICIYMYGVLDACIVDWLNASVCRISVEKSP